MDAELFRFIITLFLSGVIAALVSAIMQKRNEKESRLFNAKLEAYTEYITHLQSKFVSIAREGREPNIITLAEISAKCLLVSSKKLNEDLKGFLVEVSDVYKKLSSYDKDEAKEKQGYLWNRADKIEGLMREDLGFK